MGGRSIRGSAVADVVIAAAVVIFVLLPMFSTAMEKFILSDKTKMIRDAVDMTNIAVYNALNTRNLGKVQVDVNHSEALKILEEWLCANLGLDSGLYPEEGSVAEGPVEIISLEIYMSGFPAKCPGNTVINRPAVHSCIKVPIKPALYRRLILELLGRDYIDIELHVDSEIPVNN